MKDNNIVSALFSPLAVSLGKDDVVLSVLQSHIASEIMIRRIRSGMTQSEFANKLGVSQSTLSKWESGETNFTLSTLVSIAQKLDIRMQSPFVSTPPKAYALPNSNVYAFPSIWSSSSYSEPVPTTYETAESKDSELIEM